jgi:hypothetical protein
MTSCGQLLVHIRCVNLMRHQLAVMQVLHGWCSSRALLAQPDEVGD